MDSNHGNENHDPETARIRVGTPDPEDTPKRLETADENLSTAKTFFSLNGGGILYALSAMSILYGMARIIGPVLARSGKPGDALPCLGALNLYELALLGALFVLAVAWDITRDAVVLAVLAAVFLVTSGIAVDTVAIDSPVLAAGIAGACFILAAAKLGVLRRYIHLRIGILTCTGAAIIVGWNFLAAPGMAYAVVYDLVPKAAFVTFWRLMSLPLLSGGLLLLIQAAHTQTGAARREQRSAPFLRTPGMAWTFLAILLAGANIQQYALGYLFDIPLRPWDYLPWIALFSLLTIELARNYAKELGLMEMAAALVPLACVFCASKDTGFAWTPLPSLDLLWHPTILLGMMGLAMAWMGTSHPRAEFLVLAGVYGLAVILMAGVEPARFVDPHAHHVLNWRAFAIVMGLGFALAGLWFRLVWVAMVAVAILSAVAFTSAPLHALWTDQPLVVIGHLAMIAGLGTMAVYAYFRSLLPREIAIAASLMLSAGTLLCLHTELTPVPLFVVGLGLGATGLLVWYRTGDTLVAAIHFAPVVWSLRPQAGGITPWQYIALSFLLLGAGMGISLFANRARRT